MDSWKGGQIWILCLLNFTSLHFTNVCKGKFKTHSHQAMQLICCQYLGVFFCFFVVFFFIFLILFLCYFGLMLFSFFFVILFIFCHSLLLFFFVFVCFLYNAFCNFGDFTFSTYKRLQYFHLIWRLISLIFSFTWSSTATHS